MRQKVSSQSKMKHFIMKEEDFIKQVKVIIESRSDLAKEAYRIYKTRVEHLLANKTQNMQEIERLLDGLLDFCFDEKLLLLYRKVYRYYYTISPKNTIAYIEHYKEMYDPYGDEFGKDG